MMMLSERSRSARHSGDIGSSAVISRKVGVGWRECWPCQQLTGAGHIAQNTGAVGEAEQHFQAVLEMRRHLGDEAGVARALSDLGWIAWRQCDFPKALRLSAECLTLAERIGATRVAALALTNLGAAALFEGELAEAAA